MDDDVIEGRRRRREVALWFDEAMDTTAATPTTRCSTSRPQLITTITGLVVTGRPPATQPRHRRPNVYYRPETRDVTVTSSHRHGGATCWTGVTDVENTAATRLNSTQLNSTQLNGDCEQRLPLERAMSIVYSCSIQYCSMCHASRRALSRRRFRSRTGTSSCRDRSNIYHQTNYRRATTTTSSAVAVAGIMRTVVV